MAFLTSHVRKQKFQFPKQLRQLVYHVYWLISVMVSRFNYCFFALYFSAYSISVAVKKNLLCLVLWLHCHIKESSHRGLPSLPLVRSASLKVY